MKYVNVKTDRAISNERISGFVSIAVKYPWCAILKNARICKKIAPPKQLKPTICMITLILWLNFKLIVVIDRYVIMIFSSKTPFKPSRTQDRESLTQLKRQNFQAPLHD